MKTKCIKCNKSFKDICRHKCKADITKEIQEIYNVNSIGEFFQNVTKFLETRDIKIEFDEYPDSFGNNEFTNWNYKGPGWSGNFRGKLRSNYNISLSNLFGWGDSIFPGIETGSGTSGKNFSLSGSRIDLRLFPKLYREWEIKGNLGKKYKQDYIESVEKAKVVFLDKRNQYIQYSNEIQEIEHQIRNIEELLKESNRLLKIQKDNLEKEFNSKNHFELPDPNEIQDKNFKEIQKFTHVIPEVKDENLQSKLQNVNEKFEEYTEYVKNHPQYFI